MNRFILCLLLFFISASHADTHKKRRLRPHFHKLEQRESSLETPPSENGPLETSTAAINFTALTLSDTFAFPPDSMGAVGPTQYLAVCNGRIRSFLKTTGAMDGVLNETTETFFSSVLQMGGFTSDPRVKYDRSSDRWFVIMLGIIDEGDPDRIMVAVSDGGILTGGTVWSYYYFLPAPDSSPDDFADFPTLGIDVNALYIGVNFFDGTFGSFLNSAAFVIPKASLIGGSLTVYPFRDLLDPMTGYGPISPQGVDSFDSATVGYIIGTDGSSFGRLILRRITDPGGTPSISDNIPITIPSTYYPSTVPHKGNTGGASGYLDGIDDRLCGSHIRSNKLYTVHNIGTNSHGVSSPSLPMSANGCRWYEISLGDSPTLNQSGTIYDTGSSKRRNYWMPSVMTNGLRSLGVGFSTAGQSAFIDAGYAVRYVGDTSGKTRTPVLYTSSKTSYNPPSDSGGFEGRRWGDYSTMSLDPADNMTFWTIQEFCNATNSYGCRVVSILAAPPPKISSCTPSRIAINQSSVDLIIRGKSSNGSAFYDPPMDFANHLSITLGNVTINSITSVAPTEIHLNVSTVGASKGSKTGIITNPDGQQSSTARVLSVF
jgi:hypothetical protein